MMEDKKANLEAARKEKEQAALIEADRVRWHTCGRATDVTETGESPRLHLPLSRFILLQQRI